MTTASCELRGAFFGALLGALLLLGCGGAPAAPRAPRHAGHAAAHAAEPLLGGDARDAYAVAEAHRARGKRYYETQRYEQAITEFQAGYDTAPWPVFLFNMAQARKQLGDCRAVQAFRRFLVEIEARSPADPARVAAEPGIPVARRNLGQLEPSCATAMRLPTRPRPRRWYERRGVILAMAGGAALAGAGGGLLGWGERTARDAHAAVGLDETDRLAARATHLRLAGAAALGLGLAGITAAYVHHRTHPSFVEEITVEVGNGEATAWLGGRF